MDTAQPRPTTPRIAPVPDSERDDRVRALLDDFVVGPTVNVYTTMARHPDVLARCIPLGRALRNGQLSLREREILILRTGWLCRAEYEFAQHSRLALEGGMTEADLERIMAGPRARGWEPTEAALLCAADELHEQACITEATWSALSECYDDERMIEITMLCGYYHMISYFLNSAGVALEPGARGFPR